jgi:hypothetical protein
MERRHDMRRRTDRRTGEDERRTDGVQDLDHHGVVPLR